MIGTLYKVILTFVGLLFVQGCILPWVLSNNVLPVWADLGILSLIVCLWIFIIEKLVSNAMKRFGKDCH